MKKLMLAWAARRQSDGPRWNRRPTWAPTTRWSSWPALTKPTKARVPIGPSVVEEQPGSFEMPEYQDDLIQKMVAANPHTVVVLHRGGSMDVQKWIARVPGLVHAIFPGQDGGRALAEILLGDVNPSGKLPFTFEKRFEDNPAYPNYPNDLSVDSMGNTAVYREGIFVGYRGYEKNGVQPEFPFGFGLSYTTFAYSDLDIESAEKDDDGKKGGREAGRE